MAEPRTYPLTTVISVALFTLGFGIGAGIVIGRGGHPDPVREGRGGRAGARGEDALPAGTPVVEVVVPPARPGEVPEEEEAGRLSAIERRAIEERETAERLQEGASGPKGEADRGPRPEEVYDSLLKLDEGEIESGDFLKLLERLGELGDEEAAYFIERYLANVGRGGNAKEREVALMLAIMTGGDGVASFLSEFLTDPLTPGMDRRRFLARIGSPREPIYSMNRIPMTGALATTAYELLGSQKALERRGAAGLLGGLDTPQSRSSLEFLVETDRDFGVRTAAIQSLARVGDATTKQFLSNYYETLALHPKQKAFKRLKGPLQAAIRTLEKKYP